MERQNLTIETVVNDGLCTGCGGCKGICPKNAITMQRNAAGFLAAGIDQELCVDCGLCLKICPSKTSPQRDKNAMIGECRGSYVAYACDREIRENGQSGGVVTALLAYLLEEKEIDGAVISGYTQDEGKSAAKVATTREELLHAQGSSYIQNEMVGEFLKGNKCSWGGVFLGCQTRALRNIEQYIPHVKQPVIKIGLFCASAQSANYIKEVKGQLLKKETHYQYRARDKRYGGVWSNAVFQSGKLTCVVPRKRRIRAFDIWKNYKCSICTEFFNTAADIVCGDPWGLHTGKDADQGYSILIVRTEKGRKLVERAFANNIISGHAVDYEKIINGQNAFPRLLQRNQKDENYYKKLYFSKGFQQRRITWMRGARYDFNAFKIMIKGYIKKLIGRK